MRAKFGTLLSLRFVSVSSAEHIAARVGFRGRGMEAPVTTTDDADADGSTSGVTPIPSQASPEILVENVKEEAAKVEANQLSGSDELEAHRDDSPASANLQQVFRAPIKLATPSLAVIARE